MPTNLTTKDLILDDQNANQGTVEGAILIGRSMSELGAGRSVLLDKNNKLIAGNSATKAAIEAGIIDVIVVETDGSQLVAVRRKDIDINSKKGREMAIADNATSSANLSWNQDNLHTIAEEWGIDTNEWNISEDIPFDYSILDEMSDNSFRDEIRNSDKMQVTFIFDKKDKPLFEDYLREIGKQELQSQILKIVEDYATMRKSGTDM